MKKNCDTKLKKLNRREIIRLAKFVYKVRKVLLLLLFKKSRLHLQAISL